MTRPIRNLSIAAGLALAAMAPSTAPALAQPIQNQPIQVSFLWHMHQPRYVPGQSIFGADSFFTFSLLDVHNSRFGPYTTWPRNAVNSGSSLPNLGAHVSFSGSLMQNLNELESANVNGGMWSNWESPARGAQSNLTALGNRRLDMLAFGYHHPLMPLIDERSIRKQIQLHKHAHGQTWNTGYSAGMFPPETAFSTRMIPALVAEGIDWIMVDNIHFDRATQGYPHTDATGIAAPNRADQINPNPELSGGRWVQLQNLWAPSRVSVPFGYQPHLAQHVDPDTGAISRIVAVPAARYEGNEDGRGGYGAFLYDQVMDAYLPDNNAADRPMLVLLHHDGDNFGGGSEAYYHSNFQNMVNWAQNNANYNVTTVDDYLERFPVPNDALIHIEDGSWAGADSGDPEFKRWLGGDVSAGAISPDINSWAALVAATNAVHTLDDVLGATGNNTTDPNDVIFGTGTRLERAWHFLLTGQASDYWYWDGTEVWDSNVTVASNNAVAQVNAGLPGSYTDTTAPTVFVPQREPYNPGSVEFGTVQPRDFEVWTLVHDLAGLQSVTLRYRIDADGQNPLASIQNETYAGGPEVGSWQSLAMTPAAVVTPSGVTPATVKATRFGAVIAGLSNTLVDYYVEATDAHGNTERSPIRHVWVGDGSGGGGGSGTVTLDPDPAVAGQPVTISYDANGTVLNDAATVYAHVGFNGWSSVIEPDPAMNDSDGDGVWDLTLSIPTTAETLQVVFNDGGGVWDNNGGQDWSFPVTGGEPGDTWTLDGTLDADATPVATNGGLTLWAGLKGTSLYLATQPPSSGNDRFLALAQAPGAMQPAMWGKSGQVAAWDAFVGAEESNGFAGWFDTSAGQLARGTVLEATIDLAAEFGAVPSTVAAAVLSYASPDAGQLVPGLQVSASLDANGSVEPAEFLTLDLCALTVAGCCPADFDDDGDITVFDILAYLTAWNANDPAADQTNDGAINVFDILAFLELWNAGCP